MPEIVADLPDASCSLLLFGVESRYFNHLLLISLGLARARGRGPSSAPAKTPGFSA